MCLDGHRNGDIARHSLRNGATHCGQDHVSAALDLLAACHDPRSFSFLSLYLRLKNHPAQTSRPADHRITRRPKAVSYLCGRKTRGLQLLKMLVFPGGPERGGHIVRSPVELLFPPDSKYTSRERYASSTPFANDGLWKSHADIPFSHLAPSKQGGALI